MMSEDEMRDWTITLTFDVPAGDTEGAFTEAIFESALEHAPADSTGYVAGADTTKGEVRVTFTLLDRTQSLADSIAREMRERIRESVLPAGTSHITAV